MNRKLGSKIETWINQETGEVKEVVPVEIAESDKGFDKIWVGMLLAALDVIGNKKMDIVSYIIEKRSRTENTITVSQKKIAEDLNVSTQTVNLTMKALKEVGFLVQVVPGHYRLNPSVIWRGSHFARMAIMAKFSEEKGSETPEEAKTEPTPTPSTPTPPEAEEPQICDEIDPDNGERCGGHLIPERQADGVWMVCDRCGTATKVSGSVAEYSATSKPAA